jgi:Ser/Thr protein kinase RdoA (MazF antagonist)
MSIEIGTLLSPEARIIHQRNRLTVSKRIVVHGRNRYVLQRFRRRATFERFILLMQQMAEAGASVQRIVAHTDTAELQRRHGYWVALDFVRGQPLRPKAAPRTVISFGRCLARLHSIEGPESQPLFVAHRPTLPHAAYLRAMTLSPEERAWIRDSGERLRRVPANHLTHGDVYGENVIVARDLSVALIDYELMAFERAGIELAITLLRPFCRRTPDRSLLVRTYLAQCGAANAEAWRLHATDFLFAAAARLSLQRRWRRWGLLLTDSLLKARVRLIPFGKAGAERSMRINASKKRIGERNEAYYEHVARAVVRDSLAGASDKPLHMLARINAEYFIRT